MFIRLTSANDINPGIDIYVDADSIQFFNISDSGNTTFIKLKTQDFLFVKEKPRDILKSFYELL